MPGLRFGCSSAVASSWLAPQSVKGKTVEEALTIKYMDIAKELCLPPVAALFPAG